MFESRISAGEQKNCFRKSHVRAKKLDVQETEAEIISLDAGLRMDGIPTLTLWHL